MILKCLRQLSITIFASARLYKISRLSSSSRSLRFALPEFRTRWKFRRDGAVTEVAINGNTLISNALSLRRAARDGLGAALLADWLVRRELAEGTLIDLFPDHDCTATTFDTGAWALYPSKEYLPRKVRSMIDFLRDRLRSAGPHLHT